MIIGAHTIIYSRNAEADRKFFRDILKLPNVDTGGGWLIFSMPKSEAAVHPASKNSVHELYFIVDDIDAFIKKMKKYKIKCSPVMKREWGLLTEVKMPGGGKLGFYEATHKRP
jgi:hypothetical protein